MLPDMNTATENRIDVKLFIGCLLTSEIRLYLLQNIAWKQAKIDPSNHPLLEIQHEGKEYLGMYLPSRSASLKELKKIEEETLAAISSFCPQLNQGPVKLYVFPQLFIK